MAKSAQAFRTIREVADWLDVAAHVLRFWESKFTQIKPVKRAGGRRYYRPADMELVGGIKVLLHERGLTIRGVQKLISDEGLDAVTSLSPPIEGLLTDDDVVEVDPISEWDQDAAADALAEPDETSEQADPAETATDDVPNEGSEPEANPEVPTEEETTTEDASPTVDAQNETGPDITLDPSDDVEPLSEETAANVEPEPEPEMAAPPELVEPAILPPAALPPSNPAEGRLGALAALTALPVANRAAMAPQIAALTALRDRMAQPATTTQDHS